MRWISTDDELIPLFRELCDYTPTDHARVIFEFDDGMPVAAAMYDHYNGKTIHQHVWIAVDKRPSRVWWWAIHDYTFNQLRAKVCLVMTSSSNRKAIELARHMGYKFAARIPEYYSDGDAMVFTGTERDATFWKRYRDGKTPPPTYDQSNFERA